ncbi:hypothetical protein CCE01nite_20370 [Cellulomonas cellasea]|uniref:Uncharacterized protein n=1 Tax=Cellulomonas cellasea TaxID=43670 RepID=A0A4Y3KZ35_9CELL|nr:hypothetical protein CCE01nite_20370 [Cellulomonas cellasea]
MCPGYASQVDSGDLDDARAPGRAAHAAPDAPLTRAQIRARERAAAPQGLDDLYDIGRLADRLGVEHATIRVWLSRKVPWLPAPDGRLNGGAVWRASTLEGIEQRRTPGRPGRRPRTVAQLISETQSIPVVSVQAVLDPLPTSTGQVPLVAPAP